MAGNGTEWTRAVVVSGTPPKVVEGEPTKDDDLVVLRGRRFTLPDRLTYKRMKYELEAVPQTQFAGDARVFTGFRVVVPVP